jgi:hypothetical protein
MERSESIVNLIAALASVQNELPEVTKTRTADTGKYSYTYADLPDIISATRPILLANGLVITQVVGEIYDCNGSPIINVETMLIHTSGEYIIGKGSLIIPRTDPQAVGSAITYARRYGYCAIIGLAAEEDDDAAAAMPIEQHQASKYQHRQIPAVKLTPSIKPSPAPARSSSSNANADAGSFIMPIGKYQGKRLADIPLGYLQWVLDSRMRIEVKNAVGEYINQLANEPIEEPWMDDEDSPL